jgi:hypothetical protein
MREGSSISSVKRTEGRRVRSHNIRLGN